MARILDRSQFAEGNIRTDLSMGVVAELTHSARLAAYRTYWEMFKGNHWSYHRGDDQPLVTINYARRYVTIVAGWVFKKGFEVTIPDDPMTEGVSDKKERDFIAQALNETWRANGVTSWGLEAGQMGGVTGDLFLRPAWEANDDLENPYVRVDILPSHYVYPEFGGPHGADRKKMTQCMVLFPQYTFKTSIFGKTRQSVKMNGEIWTPEEWKIIEDEKVIETRPNPFGEIPIVHVPNFLLAGEFYGISDLADVVELQRLFNEKTTDVSDVIAYHGSPVTIVKGQSIKQLERGANQMWGIKKNADIFNLELKGELNASTEFLDRVERLMSMVSGVPKEAMGNISKAANTSAVAMALRFLPLSDIRDMKIATYGLGIRRVNRLIMKLLKIKNPAFRRAYEELQARYPQSNLYRNDVVFHSPMPRDELVELQKIKERLLVGISTRRMEMKKQGLSEEEIREVLEDSKREAEEEARRELGYSDSDTLPDLDGRATNTTPQGAGRDEIVSANNEGNMVE